jgi:hypothetical protein
MLSSAAELRPSTARQFDSACRTADGSASTAEEERERLAGNGRKLTK